ncbi:MAG: 3-phosphoshikimate 1-carboxyvinyltransferase [Bacteroidota bacterium]|jgi:3-phosphoshikimate 1-carboxyvinyltransferase
MVLINPSKLSQNFVAPIAKSHLQRELLLAACSNEESVLVGNLTQIPDDALHALVLIESLGCTVDRSDNQWKITPPRSMQKFKRIELHVGESGFLLRSIISVGFLFSEELILHASGTLLDRNLQGLARDFMDLGIHQISSEGAWPLVLRKDRDFSVNTTLDVSMTSQTASGALIAMAAAKGKYEVFLENPVSKPYLEFTLQCLRSRGVEALLKENVCTMNSTGIQGGTVQVQGDWSGAANLLCMGAMSGQVSVKGLLLNSLQADELVLDVLRNYGAAVEIDSEGINVANKEQNPFQVDLTDAPDLFPVLSVLAASANGDSRLEGIHRLASKESDRLASTRALLDVLGVVHRTEGNGLIIHGGMQYQGDIINSFKDHRIILAAVVASKYLNESLWINSVQEITKSFKGLDFY